MIKGSVSKVTELVSSSKKSRVAQTGQFALFHENGGWINVEK